MKQTITCGPHGFFTRLRIGLQYVFTGKMSLGPCKIGEATG